MIIDFPEYCRNQEILDKMHEVKMYCVESNSEETALVS